MIEYLRLSLRCDLFANVCLMILAQEAAQAVMNYNNEIRLFRWFKI